MNKIREAADCTVRPAVSSIPKGRDKREYTVLPESRDFRKHESKCYFLKKLLKNSDESVWKLWQIIRYSAGHEEDPRK